MSTIRVFEKGRSFFDELMRPGVMALNRLSTRVSTENNVDRDVSKIRNGEVCGDTLAEFIHGRKKGSET